MPHSVNVDEVHAAAAEELLPQDILREFDGVNACGAFRWMLMRPRSRLTGGDALLNSSDGSLRQSELPLRPLVCHSSQADISLPPTSCRSERSSRSTRRTSCGRP